MYEIDERWKIEKEMENCLDDLWSISADENRKDKIFLVCGKAYHKKRIKVFKRIIV